MILSDCFASQVYPFAKAAVKTAQPGGVKSRNVSSHRSWRPEIQDQGDGGATVAAKTPGEDPALCLPASGGPRCSLAAHFNLYLLRHTACSVCTSLSRFLTSLWRHQSFWIKGPPSCSMMSLNLTNYIWNNPFPNKVRHVHRYWGAGVQGIFLGGRSSACNSRYVLRFCSVLGAGLNLEGQAGGAEGRRAYKWGTSRDLRFWRKKAWFCSGNNTPLRLSEWTFPHEHGGGVAGKVGHVTYDQTWCLESQRPVWPCCPTWGLAFASTRSHKKQTCKTS